MISGVGIFFLGCGVSTYHGISGLINPHQVMSLSVGLSVLLFSFLVEGTTLVVACRSCLKGARDLKMPFFRYVIDGPDPMATSVLLEDAVAVVGVMVAESCLALTVSFDSVGCAVKVYGLKLSLG